MRFLDYPEPLAGSHEAVGLSQTWHSAEGRYGIYGFGDDSVNYSSSRITWNDVDWAQLQNDCTAVNSFRFSMTSNMTSFRRFTYADSKHKPMILVPPRNSSQGTGRTAIVLRSWSTFRYTQEDMWNIRSLIAEAALSTGGSSTVFLLVDVQDQRSEFLRSRRSYDNVLNHVVPRELRGITVLFDKSLLESWYPLTGNHAWVRANINPLRTADGSSQTRISDVPATSALRSLLQRIRSLLAV